MRLLLLGLFALLTLTNTALARRWTDASGHYSVDADLIAFNARTVVLQKAKNDLISAPIKSLSKADRDHLETLRKADTPKKSAAYQVWELNGGWKVEGDVVSYMTKDFVVELKDGDIVVNDQPFAEMSAVRQQIMPRIVGSFENLSITTTKQLEAWAAKQDEPRTFETKGVLVRLRNEELLPVPFFFFSDDDLKLLEPGYESWVSNRKTQVTRPADTIADVEPENTPAPQTVPEPANSPRDPFDDESLYLEAMAKTYYQDRSEMRRIQQLRFQLEAYQAGLFDLWEVALYPKTFRSYPLRVVVPGRNSNEARINAVRRYPGHTVGAIAKVRN